MTQQDILEFYGTSDYRYDFQCPDGTLNDDLLACRKGIMCDLRKQILDDLRDEVLKELQHGIDCALAGLNRLGRPEREASRDALNLLKASHCIQDFLQHESDQRELAGKTPWSEEEVYLKERGILRQKLEQLLQKSLRARDLLLQDPEDRRGWEVAGSVFESHMWEESYGGEAWMDIAHGAQRLARAKKLDDIWIAIDGVISLMHNNRAIVDDFPSGERFWLLQCLTRKAKSLEGWFMHLKVPSVFKGEHRGRPNTCVYGNVAFEYNEDEFMYENFVYDLHDFLGERVWAYIQVARAHHAHSRWVLAGDHVAAGKTLGKLLRQNLGKAVAPLAAEINSMNGEARSLVKAELQRWGDKPDVLMWTHGAWDTAENKMGKVHLEMILKQIRKVFSDLWSAIKN